MRLFSTDIDGTIYDGPETAAFFKNYWESLCAGVSTKPLLAFNTGRSVAHTMELVETGELPVPDYLICGVGTIVQNLANGTHDEGYSARLAENWNFDIVQEVVTGYDEAIEQQPEKSQNPHKCSFYYENASPETLERIIRDIAGLGVSAQAVYSSNRDLDFLPVSANKGNAVAYLAESLGIPNSEVVVAGDSGNDARMFLVPGVKGVVVSNAEESLKDIVSNAGTGAFFATEPCAMGVAQGIDHFTR